MYRRSSRFYTRRPSSMLETESRLELHNTLEKLDCGISMKKKAILREKPVTVWSFRRKACLGALFLMYALLVVPCVIDLVNNLISSRELDKILRILEEAVHLHSSTVAIIHNFHCMFMNMDCEEKMLNLLSHRQHVCPGEDYLGNVVSAIVQKQNAQNSSVDHGRNVSTESAFSSFSCAGATFLNLHTAAVPKIGSMLVQSLKFVHASYSAFDVLIELYSHCIVGTHSDLHHLLHEINFVKGQLLSFFLKQTPDDSIAQLDLLLKETYNAAADGESSDLCSNMTLQGYLSSVHEITNISQRQLKQLLRFTQSEYKWTIIIQTMYFIVLFAIPFICIWHFVEYWRRLVLVQKFSHKYNAVSDQLLKEQLEFKSILSEVIPRSNFGEFISEGSKISLMSSVFRTDSHCEPVQVSFSDNEGSDEGEDKDRQIRNSRISMINRFKQKSNPMGTIHETHSIYDKLTKKMSPKNINPSTSNEVTIFRSDIVGFSRTIKHFTPSETVNLVSYLIKLFDERIQLYDVFVLGREVDSFTVVSGISLAQITRHASEIVNMALDLMSISSDLEFQAGPETKLRLRMGIHTGTAYSRQIGFPKPRYNISGELLEVVKKIVRNAQPNQIQVSETTYQLLCRHIAYNLGKSGYITTETNKNIKVYTLNGRRVSEDVTARDCPGRRTAWMPIQLEQKALYRFEAEENRYLAPLNWMLPRDCHSLASGSTSSSFSNAPAASRRSSITRSFKMSTQETLNETLGF